jgi:hypothetical protein
MTPKAAESFAAYVALGSQRTLAKVAADQVRQGYGKTVATRTRILEGWSVEYGWQERLRLMSEAKLNEANELRADIYLRIIREYDRRTRDAMAAAMKLPDLHGVHDRIKFPDPERHVVEGDADAPITIRFVRDGAD